MRSGVIVGFGRRAVKVYSHLSALSTPLPPPHPSEIFNKLGEAVEGGHAFGRHRRLLRRAEQYGSCLVDLGGEVIGAAPIGVELVDEAAVRGRHLRSTRRGP